MGHRAILGAATEGSPMPLTELQTVPGVATQPPAETAGFVFNHTMLRVKDASASLDFYTRVLGYQLIDKRDFAEAQFSLYFLALLPAGTAVPESDADRRLWMAGMPGVLELTHNHGTEAQDGPVYHDGNSDPRGFGHICVSVPDIQSACKRFDELQVPYQKRLEDGRMKHLAFIKDPDGYWVEIISNA
jgi:lactoylglutathione lyase